MGGILIDLDIDSIAISIGSWNIRGLSSKLIELSILMTDPDNPIDIIGIQESRQRINQQYNTSDLDCEYYGNLDV